MSRVFDGSSYFLADDATQLNLTIGAPGNTVLIWVKPDSNATTPQNVFWYYDDAAGNTPGSTRIRVQLNQSSTYNKWYAQWRNPTGYNYTAQPSGDEFVRAAEWQVAVYTTDVATNYRGRLYVDDSTKFYLANSASLHYVHAITAPFFGIGVETEKIAQSSTPTRNTRGKLAHIAVWGRSLDISEIDALMKGAHPTTVSGLIHYWPLLTGTGDAIDEIGGVNLTMVGTVGEDTVDNPPVDVLPVSEWTATGLPPSLTMDIDTGRTTGTLTSVGTYNPVVTYTNEAGSYPAAPFQWKVINKPVAPTYSSRSDIRNKPVNVNLATGWTNAAPNGFSALNLPTGLTMSNTGVVTGTPSTVQSRSVTVRNTTEASTISATAFSWVIRNIPIAPAYSPRYNFAGSAITVYLSDGWQFPNPTGYTVDQLPAGLSMSASGTVTGTPTTPGTTSVTVTNTLSADVVVADPFNWQIIARPVPPTYGSRQGIVGTPENVNLATGWTNPNPTGYSATGLPTGLSMNSSGVVTGTPTTVQTRSVVVTNTTVAGAVSASGFQWQITAAPVLPVPPTYQDRTSVRDDPVMVNLATGWTGADANGYTVDQLPAGLVMNAQGQVSGTPTTVEAVVVTVSNTNAAGTVAAGPFTWNIVAPPPQESTILTASRLSISISISL